MDISQLGYFLMGVSLGAMASWWQYKEEVAKSEKDLQTMYANIQAKEEVISRYNATIKEREGVNADYK